MATVAEPLVTPTETSFLYMARRQSLRLIHTPRYDRYGAGGRKLGEDPGVAVAFSDGVLRVPKEGKVTLEDGRQVDADEIARWLDSHRLLGDIEEGFWRVDPSAPPVSEEEIERLMDAAMRLDVELLDEMARQEREGWGREAVIRRAEESAAKIRAALAAQEAEQAEEQAKPAGKPAK
jgi:hypothetical protein